MTGLTVDSNNLLDETVKRDIINYIERCRLPDGGYFFARVPPSSGMDTYYAVKSLSILGVSPYEPQSVIDFFYSQYKAGALNGTAGIFSAVETLNELGGLDNDIIRYAGRYIISLQNQAGGFGAVENVDIEVISELQETYRAVKILKTINAGFNRNAVNNFILTRVNKDGGYGKGGYSTLSSTYYAVGIHNLLNNNVRNMKSTLDYLRKREQRWEVQYIEDIYWLTMGLANLEVKTNVPEKIMNFVMNCRRANGSFSRATAMGIATLEYTFYALSILKEINALPGQVQF